MWAAYSCLQSRSPEAPMPAWSWELGGCNSAPLATDLGPGCRVGFAESPGGLGAGHRGLWGGQLSFGSRDQRRMILGIE